MKAAGLRIVAICLCLVGMCILPYLIPITHVNMAIEIAFFSLLAMSFNMLFGYGGMLSFGHSAYFGIGAYTTALLFKHFTGLPLILSLLLGGIAGALGGLLAGFFCVRLKGAYFALLTMAFNQFFFAIALKWRSLTGGDDGYRVSDTEEIHRTLAFPAGGASHRLVIDNLNGSITVTGYAGDDVQVSVHRVTRGDSREQLEEGKKKITLDVREEEGRIILYVNTPWRCGDGSPAFDRRDYYGYDADFTFDVRVPAATEVFVKTVNKGSITVTGVRGDFEVHNVNGPVAMTGIGGSGLASTVNGGVDVRFSRNPTGRCGFRTVNGTIEVSVPDDLSADLRLKTFNGDVRSDFDVTGLPQEVPPPRKIGRRTVYGGDEFFSVRAGSGGPAMEFETLNGDIRILKAH